MKHLDAKEWRLVNPVEKEFGMTPTKPLIRSPRDVLPLHGLDDDPPDVTVPDRFVPLVIHSREANRRGLNPVGAATTSAWPGSEEVSPLDRASG